MWTYLLILVTRIYQEYSAARLLGTRFRDQEVLRMRNGVADAEAKDSSLP